MKAFFQSRRRFLKTAAVSAGALVLPRPDVLGWPQTPNSVPDSADPKPADCTMWIMVSPIEIAPNRFISTTNYSG